MLSDVNVVYNQHCGGFGLNWYNYCINVVIIKKEQKILAICLDVIYNNTRDWQQFIVNEAHWAIAKR